MHERIQHNLPNVVLDDAVPESSPPLPGAFLSIPAKLDPPQELVQLLANADIQHEVASEKYIGVDGGHCETNVYNTKFIFGDCTVVVDTEKNIGTYFDANSLDLSFQSGPSTLPMQLLCLEQCEGTNKPFNELDEKFFEQLKLALRTPGNKHESACGCSYREGTWTGGVSGLVLRGRAQCDVVSRYSWHSRLAQGVSRNEREVMLGCIQAQKETL